MTPTVYKGDTVPIDFILKWSDGTTQNITGAAIWVAVKSVRAPAGDPPLIVRKNAAAGAGGSDSHVTITSGSGGAFTGYLQIADTDLLTDGEEYVFGGVVQLASGTYTAGVGRFIASARIPQSLS
jgi:hypothetical protein